MTDVDAYTLYQGPWWAESQVLDLLNVEASTLALAREQRRVLALQFDDGLFYYPARQFALKPQRGIVIGLKEVLDALAAGIDDADTWITWLAGRYGWREEDTETMWDILWAGQVDEVVFRAKRDAANWRS